jgi:AcrR family transcriptional regulator
MRFSDHIPPFGAPPREFAQERARRTYEALVGAALEVFTEKGYDATQTPDISAAAGVSVGTFYRYFSDKREIFLEVVRRELAQSHEEVMGQLTPDRFADKDPRAAIDAVLAILLENVNRQPGRQRLFLEMSLRDDKVAELERAFERDGRERLAQLIAAICPKEQVADPEATAYVVYTSVVECAIHMVGAHGRPPVSQERGMAALAELIYRALFGIERE